MYKRKTLERYEGKPVMLKMSGDDRLKLDVFRFARGINCENMVELSNKLYIDIGDIEEMYEIPYVKIPED